MFYAIVAVVVFLLHFGLVKTGTHEEDKATDLNFLNH